MRKSSHRTLLRMLFVLTAFVFNAAVAAAADPVPLAALFGRPAIGTVKLSPSGRWLALTRPGPNQQRLELVVADLSQQPWTFKTVAWLKDYDVASVHWLNDQRLVFTAFDSQAGEWAGVTGLWAANVDGSDDRMLIDPYWAGFRARKPLSQQILPSDYSFFDTTADGSGDVLILRHGWNAFRNEPTYELHRLNTREPRPRRLDGGDTPEGAVHWVLDEREQLRWIETVDAERRTIHRRADDGRWHSVASFDRWKAEGWWPRFMVGDNLFVSFEPAGEKGARLYLWDAEAGRPAQAPLLRAEGFDVGDSAWPLVDVATRRPLGWRYRLDTRYTRWADETMAQLQGAVDRALPGMVNELRCATCLDGKRLLVISHSDRRPTQYAVLERPSGRLIPVGSAYPDLPAEGVGARSFHRTKARDGRDLPVYVTQPLADIAAGAKPSPRPAVVYVHGGPAARLTLEWSGDPTPAFLASRGYVVIEPEFRGSVGYGVGHFVAGDGQWGLAMQDDLQDALRWAVARGLVDGKRVCIMGASYGGYAALMGPVRQPDDYRCAIAWVAPTDLPGLLSNADSRGYSAGAKRGLGRMIGAGSAERSPVNRAAGIKVPVLAAWGADDRRVPLAQGRDFRDAAQAAKVELEYVEYPGEGHVWMKPETEIDFFGRAEKLLARTIGRP